MRGISTSKYFGIFLSVAMVFSIVPINVSAQTTGVDKTLFKLETEDLEAKFEKEKHLREVEYERIKQIREVEKEAREIDDVYVDDDDIRDDMPEHTRYMRVNLAWGNVLGDALNTEKTEFSGHIWSDNPEVQAYILDAKNFERNDRVITKKNPPEWESYITTHWDGVKVAIAGPGNAIVNFTVGDNAVSMTIDELRDLIVRHITDVGQGREIVISTHKFKTKRAKIGLMWGMSRADKKFRGEKPAVNFSGVATLSLGTQINHIKEEKFERRQGDVITEKTPGKLAWKSTILGGLDGVSGKVVLNSKVNIEDVLRVEFSELGFVQEFELAELFLTKRTVVDVPVDNEFTYRLHIITERSSENKLVKVKDRSDVYLVKDGERRPILSEGVFSELELDFDDVEEITEEEMNELGEGEEVTYPDGTLLKGSGPRVFVVDGGQLRHIANEAAFNRLGYPDFKNVIEVKDSIILRLPEIDAVRIDSKLPEGALVRKKGEDGIYIIKGGKRRAIRSIKIFRSNKYDFKDVLEVDDELFDEIEDGEDLPFADGIVLAFGDDLYLMDGEEKHIIDREDLAVMDVQEDDLIDVDFSELESLPTGEEMIFLT